jgi:hypothetical protein
MSAETVFYKIDSQGRVNRLAPEPSGPDRAEAVADAPDGRHCAQ